MTFSDGYKTGYRIAELLQVGGVRKVSDIDKAILKTMTDFELRQLREEIRAELSDRHERRVAQLENNGECTESKGCIASC